LHEVLDRSSMLELLLLLRCRRLLLLPLHLLHERLLLLLLMSLVLLAHGTQGVATRAQQSAGCQAISIRQSERRSWYSCADLCAAAERESCGRKRRLLLCAPTPIIHVLARAGHVWIRWSGVGRGSTTSLLLGVGARALKQLLELGIHLLLLLPREGMLQGHQRALVSFFLRNAWLMSQT
jgi:hypothetical protein